MREKEQHYTDKDQFVIGRNPVLEGVQNGSNIEKVWIDKVIRGPFEKDLRFACRQRKIPLQVVPKDKLDYISRNKQNQGVVAQLSHLDYYEINDVVQQCYELGKSPFFLLLDGVEDVRNMGAIARSALWYGVHGLVVPLKGSARINAGAIKSSAGALLSIKVCKVDSLTNSIVELKEQGLQIVGADMLGTSDITSVVNNEQGVALVMGAEGKGLSLAAKKLCDQIISIEGTQQIDSLNVSVAAGILLNDLYKIVKDNI